MKKALISVALLIAFAAVILLVVNFDRNAENNPQSTTESSTEPATTSETLIIGEESAPVTIIEYIDFKCPNCYQFLLNAGENIMENYVNVGKAKFEIRMLPYLGLDARPAAEGAYCANNQGSFRDYHDAIFKFVYDNYYSQDKSLNDNVYTVENLRLIASSSNLDVDEFENCVTSNQMSDAVDADLAASRTDGVTGTPTIIIGGRKIIGQQPYQIFRSLIESELR